MTTSSFFRSLSRGRLLRLGIGLLLVGALVAMASRFIRMEETFRTLASLEVDFLGLILILALLYYALKALRWHFYLRVVGIRVALLRSVAAYLAGQWFTFTPAGELMRAYLVGEGRRFALVAPTVFMQAAIDLASLSLIATVMTPFYPSLTPIILPLTVPLLLMLVIAATPARRRFALAWTVLRRVRLLRSDSGVVISEELMRLLAPWPVVAGLLMGVPASLVGALALYASGVALGIEGWAPLSVIAVYALAQLVGGVSPLPQGLGLTEGSGTLMLVYVGVEPEQALAAMLLSRAAVLGLSVLLGMGAFLVLRLTAPDVARARAA
jgi:glycosyltransferase 2 family protein